MLKTRVPCFSPYRAGREVFFFFWVVLVLEGLVLQRRQKQGGSWWSPPRQLLGQAGCAGIPEVGKSDAGQESRFESFLVNNAAGMTHEEGSETSFRIFFIISVGSHLISPLPEACFPPEPSAFLF